MPTTASEDSPQAHHGQLKCSFSSMKAPKTTPNRPYRPIWIALYATSATNEADTPHARPSPLARYA